MKISSYLLVDIGNSRIKWASAGPRGPILPGGDMATADATAERIAALAEEFPEHYAIVASVVPNLSGLFSAPFAKRFGWVSVAWPGLGLRFDYPKPAEIGVDRLVAAAAIEAEKAWPAIIVQCGTATAFTVLDGQGRVCGGAIAPGLQNQLAALTASAAQLPQVDLRRPEHYLARSTDEAIRSGVLLSFQGGVKEILRNLIGELPPTPAARIFLTGGNAAYLEGALDLPHTVRPLLVFEGLRIIGTCSFREPLLYIEE